MGDDLQGLRGRIDNLGMALREALIWGWVENRAEPSYRVPTAIDGDLWLWGSFGTKHEAYEAIKGAVRKAQGR